MKTVNVNTSAAFPTLVKVWGAGHSVEPQRSRKEELEK